MEHGSNFFVMLVALFFCTCVAVALPAARSGAVQGDLSHLVNLIGKLKNLDTQHNSGGGSANSWATMTDNNNSHTDVGSSQSLDAGSVPSTADKMVALKQGILGLKKRQGAWNYDYGLGGGRFGKRYYGDYGIGGGRFGRDVDHVDIADTSDASL